MPLLNHISTDYEDLVIRWRDDPHVNAAITWSPETLWRVENVPREREHPRCRFLTTDSQLIVVRDGWIAGADRGSADAVYGFGPDSGSLQVVTSWLCSHVDEVADYHRMALRMLADGAEKALENFLDTNLAGVRW